MENKYSYSTLEMWNCSEICIIHIVACKDENSQGGVLNGRTKQFSFNTEMVSWQNS